MTRDDITCMAREQGLPETEVEGVFRVNSDDLGRLLAAEREKVAHWMMQRGYATGHGDTLEDLLQELDWQIAENWTRAMVNGAAAEREECAKVCEIIDSSQDYYGDRVELVCAEAIRARGAS